MKWQDQGCRKHKQMKGRLGKMQIPKAPCQLKLRWHWHRNYLYFQITNWFWKPDNIDHPWIICSKINFLEDTEGVNSNKCPLHEMWTDSRFSHPSRAFTIQRWNNTDTNSKWNMYFQTQAFWFTPPEWAMLSLVS